MIFDITFGLVFPTENEEKAMVIPFPVEALSTHSQPPEPAPDNVPESPDQWPPQLLKEVPEQP